ncbi:unnamed protein product, partial [Effrenium voratum]
EQAGFVTKVEQELLHFGKSLDQQGCLREALQLQVEEEGRAWRREAQNLAQNLEQLRAQLAQTMEAALWSGKEITAVRK